MMWPVEHSYPMLDTDVVDFLCLLMLVLTLLKENCCLFACVWVTLLEVAWLEERLRDLSRGQKFVDTFSFHMNCNLGLGQLCIFQSYGHWKLNVLYLYLLNWGQSKKNLSISVNLWCYGDPSYRWVRLFSEYMSAKQMLILIKMQMWWVAKKMLTDSLQEQPRDPMGLHAA